MNYHHPNFNNSVIFYATEFHWLIHTCESTINIYKIFVLYLYIFYMYMYTHMHILKGCV